MNNNIYCTTLFIGLLSLISCQNKNKSPIHQDGSFITTIADSSLTPSRQSIVLAAKSLIDPTIKYDPQYFTIDYPMGDVPASVGVCTDVVIRTYRKVGIDLQQLVHEDMKKDFKSYPKIWGLKNPDSNIDHRRVPNLMTFFNKYAETKPLSHNGNDYLPGDIVCWSLDNGMTHIGIIIDEWNKNRTHRHVVHNIGSGQVIDDILFSYKIIGHYYFSPK